MFGVLDAVISVKMDQPSEDLSVRRWLKSLDSPLSFISAHEARSNFLTQSHSLLKVMM